MLNQLAIIVVVLYNTVNAVSMGGRVCHKTITKYTPEEFVNNIICKNGIYKQMLFKKNCVNDDCPVCNSKNVVLKWPTGLIEMENCESDIADIKRKSHASSICLSLLQDAHSPSCMTPIESLIDTCPVVPKKFMHREMRELLAFECCRNSLVKNEKQLTCTGAVDVGIVNKFSFLVKLPNGSKFENELDLHTRKSCCAQLA